MRSVRSGTTRPRAGGASCARARPSRARGRSPRARVMPRRACGRVRRRSLARGRVRARRESRDRSSELF
eukprot:25943-Pelagococcus_subviridis.AAC.2